MKVPFALNKETGAIVEVGDVLRGRKSGCICLSCKGSLLARHGEENKWHFAHDKDAQDQPIKECDISFESACRLFAIDLLKRESDLKISTPERWVVWGSKSVQVGNSKTFVVPSFQDAHEYDDVEAVVDEFTLVVHFDYSGRLKPLPPSHPDKTGILAFPVETVGHRYQAVKGGANVLANIILSIFSESDSGLRWLYHPRDAKAEELAQQLPKNIEPSINMSEAREMPTRFIGGDSYDRRDGCFRESSARNQPKPPIEFDNPSGCFDCLTCSTQWEGRKNTDRTCPKCGGHLLSHFTSKP